MYNVSGIYTPIEANAFRIPFMYGRRNEFHITTTKEQGVVDFSNITKHATETEEKTPYVFMVFF